MPRDNLGLFSPADVRAIRQHYAAGTLDVRSWADSRKCGLETIRRIARRDTYREVPDELGASPPPGAVGPPALSRDPAEPSEDELATSLAKLSQAARELPPQRAEVNALLDQLAAGREAPP